MGAAKKWKREGGIYPTWRDEETGLGFQIYGRDVPPGYQGYNCHLGKDLIIGIEAKEVGGEVVGDNYIQTVSMPLSRLESTIKYKFQENPEKYESIAQSWEGLLEVIIEGWKRAHTSDYGDRQKLEIQIDKDD